MLGKLIEKVVGNKNVRDIKRLTPLVEEINRLFETMNELTDEALKSKTAEFKTRIQKHVGDLQDEIGQLHQKLRTPPDENFDADDIRVQIEALEKQEQSALEDILMEILPEAFAVVKETCRRLQGKSWKVVEQDIVWDMVPFDVQLFGGVVLHEGKIAEMATGEGKTLVATMPLYLNALAGKGAHLVTVNDYLARRDCEWMGEIYKYLGLTVAYITHDMPPDQRKQAYGADITYGTNNEFGFDYLRDNMTGSMETVVQRPHHYAIIDEVDSVLIDEARTPLIISGPVGESKNKFAEMKPRVEKLVRSQGVLVNQLAAEGEKLLQEEKEYEAGEKLLQAFRGAPKNKRLAKLFREPGVQRLIRKVESDYMRDKRLHEIDTDLYFSIEEKANTVDLTERGRSTISPDNPELFTLPDLATLLSDIEGDESLSSEERERIRLEIQDDYAEKSERLHNISQLLKAYSLFEKDVEYVVTDDGKVMIVDEFTGRLMPGRRFSDGLHQALEAKENVRIERETQTLATVTLQNFFRLYTKLAGMTGTAETEAGEFWEIYKLDVTVIPTNEPIRRIDSDDVVFRTRREKYNAIVDEISRQLEMGIPCLVGTVSVEVSETLSRMLRRRGIQHSVLNAKHHQKEAEIVRTAGEPGMVTIATNMAGRGTDIKLGTGVIQWDDESIEDIKKEIDRAGNKTVLIHEMPETAIPPLMKAVADAGKTAEKITGRTEKESLLYGENGLDSKTVYIVSKQAGEPRDKQIEPGNCVHIKSRDYAAGGLHIIGTERHEARRIDRQLRGRSGRQGDPGSSRFYLSLEDDLMRLFGSERIAGVMDRMGLKEGEVITHPMITRSIEKAQRRVEMRNFEIRKHLLEYDNVMNKQRVVIYNRRRRALEGEDLRDEIFEMLEEYIEEKVHQYFTVNEIDDTWDIDGLRDELYRTLRIALSASRQDMEGMNQEVLTEALIRAARKTYELNQQMLGDEMMSRLERFATLRTIDERWKEHLYDMDQLREGIGLRAYGQKDPLLEYKQEAYEAFSSLLATINDEILGVVFSKPAELREGAEVLVTPSGRGPIEMAAVHHDTAGMGFARAAVESGDVQPAMPGRPVQTGKKQPVKSAEVEKIGRNDPCYCGSGKKFKHCHGKNF